MRGTKLFFTGCLRIDRLSCCWRLYNLLLVQVLEVADHMTEGADIFNLKLIFPRFHRILFFSKIEYE